MREICIPFLFTSVRAQCQNSIRTNGDDRASCEFCILAHPAIRCINHDKTIRNRRKKTRRETIGMMNPTTKQLRVTVLYDDEDRCVWVGVRRCPYNWIVYIWNSSRHPVRFVAYFFSSFFLLLSHTGTIIIMYPTKNRHHLRTNETQTLLLSWTIQIDEAYEYKN